MLQGVHVDDEGIGEWPPLGCEYKSTCFCVVGVCTQTIHGFCRETNQLSFIKELRGLFNVFLVVLNYLCELLALHCIINYKI